MVNDLRPYNTPAKHVDAVQAKSPMVRSTSGGLAKSQVINAERNCLGLPDGQLSLQEMSFYDNVPSGQLSSSGSLPLPGMVGHKSGVKEVINEDDEKLDESWLKSKFLYKYGSKKVLENGSSIGYVTESNGKMEHNSAATMSPSCSIQWEMPPKDPKPREQQPNHYPARSLAEKNGLNQSSSISANLERKKISLESILWSSGSRESVISAASMRAENKLRRYFDY
uniref:Uncharacterized protein n=1 Tax=Ditylenchus dipsaci TaxID=166011 RepID=A0A915D5F3_9BILA